MYYKKIMNIFYIIDKKKYINFFKIKKNIFLIKNNSLIIYFKFYIFNINLNNLYLNKIQLNKIYLIKLELIGLGYKLKTGNNYLNIYINDNMNYIIFFSNSIKIIIKKNYIYFISSNIYNIYKLSFFCYKLKEKKKNTKNGFIYSLTN